MAEDEEDKEHNLSPIGDQAIPAELPKHQLGRESRVLDEVLPLAYEELRVIARHHLRAEREAHTLDTSSIVHEAFIRLAAAGKTAQCDSKHFYATASKIMRHILVDHARHRQADKRGGGVPPVTLDRVGDAEAAEADDTIDIIALDEALSGLAELDPRLEQIVECRYFAGMSVAETAAVLDASVRTVERDWTRAKAYILRALERSGQK